MEDEQLHSLLQTALLLTRCVNLPSQDAAQRLLHEHSSLHSIGSYAWQTSPPIKYLAAVTDGRAQLGADCKTALKLAPTLYLALGDYVPTAEPSADKKAQQHAVPGLALHYSALRGELPYPDLPQGAQAHGLASWIAEQLPLHQLFSYLGQGYHVVIAGHGFSGAVAHLLAVRLLLSVRQEISQAQKLGINLSALEQTEEKVASFAFGSPLIANHTLSDALASTNLANQLHTVWRARDASAAFFTACSELATAAEGVTTAAAASAGTFAPPSGTSVPFQLRTAQFQAVNHFATGITAAVTTAAATNNSERRRGGMRFACEPVDVTAVQGRSAHEQGPADPVTHGEPAREASNSGNVRSSGQLQLCTTGGKSSTQSDSYGEGPGSSGRGSNHGPASSAPKPRPNGASISGNTAHGATSSPSGKSASGRLAASTQIATDRRSSKTAVTVGPPSNSGSSTPRAASHAAPHAAGNSNTDSNSTSTSGLTSSLKAVVSKANAVPQSSRYAPVGRFWVIESAPKTAAKQAAAAAKGTPPRAPAAPGALKKSAGAAAVPTAAKGEAAAGPAPQTQLSEMSAAAVTAARSTWLSDANASLVGHWEWSLEEYQRDCMEAFPWVTFRPTVKMDGGNLVSRETVIKPIPTLLLDYM